MIRPRFHAEPKVYMYGSYSKGCANPDSDIDVAIVVPEAEVKDWWLQSADLCGDVRKVSALIEPVLLGDEEDSTLYRDVMRTGIAV